MSEGTVPPVITAIEKAGGPAFPAALDTGEGTATWIGMTLRDWFAGQCLAGMEAGWVPLFEWDTRNGEYGGPEWHAKARIERAEYAYSQADAMIAERSK